MDQHEAIEQLTWYFHSAESECGNRTPLGTHLDMQRIGISFSSSRPDAELGAAARLDRMRQENSDGGDTWLRTVQARLRMVSPVSRCVLEAAFGDARTLADDESISVTLACATEAARAAHEESVAAEAARRAKAGKVPHIGLGAETCREFLDRLCNPKRSDEQKATLDRILAEAHDLRSQALQAYCETRLSEDEDVKRAELWADMTNDQRRQLEILEQFAEVAEPYHEDMMHETGVHVRVTKAAEPERVAVWRCKRCGTDFPTVVHAIDGGRPREFCSDRCKNLAAKKAYRERQRAA